MRTRHCFSSEEAARGSGLWYQRRGRELNCQPIWFVEGDLAMRRNNAIAALCAGSERIRARASDGAWVPSNGGRSLVYDQDAKRPDNLVTEAKMPFKGPSNMLHSMCRFEVIDSDNDALRSGRDAA